MNFKYIIIILSFIFISSFNFVISEQNDEIIELSGESGSFSGDYEFSGNNQVEVLKKEILKLN